MLTLCEAMQPHEKKRKPEPTSFNWDDLEAPLRRKDDDANISKPLTVVRRACSHPDDTHVTDTVLTGSRFKS